MIVLAVNCGSSSVKCRVFDVASGHKSAAVRVLAEGSVGGVPEESMMVLHTEVGVLRKAIVVDDDAGGVRRLLQELTGAPGLSRIEAVGHRIVHGGTRFTRPVLIDASVLKTLEELEELAPLHNRASIAGVRAARALLGPGVPMIAACKGGSE